MPAGHAHVPPRRISSAVSRSLSKHLDFPENRIGRNAAVISRTRLGLKRRILVDALPEQQLESIYSSLPELNEDDALLTRDDARKLTFTRNLTAVLKDNFTSSKLSSTCASNMLDGFRGPQSTVARLLEQGGVKIIATANMDEFGMGSNSTHSAHGPVVNFFRAGPGHDRMKGHSVGGSSGGSALAVATHLVDIGLGSDTGGSVRLPAAYTQTVGFKPSYGMISRNGLIPYANSLDTVGILARSTRTVLNTFHLLAKPDERDPTCLSEASRRRIEATRVDRTRAKRAQHPIWVKTIQRSGLDPNRAPAEQLHTKASTLHKRSRIGVPAEYNIEELHPLVRQAWTETLLYLNSIGHEIVPISLPTTKQALSAYYVLAPAEASSNLAKYDGVRYGAARDPMKPDDEEDGVLYAGHRGRLFGEEVQRRILLGSYTLSAGAMDNYFIQAQKVRRLVQNDFNQVFNMAHPLIEGEQSYDEGVDFIICPTAPTLPPRLEDLNDTDPLESHIQDVFTVPASLAGLPAVSVPTLRHIDQRTGSHPERAVGMQVIGQYGDDVEVLRFTLRYLERYGGWNSIKRYPLSRHRRL